MIGVVVHFLVAGNSNSVDLSIICGGKKLTELGGPGVNVDAPSDLASRFDLAVGFSSFHID